MSTKVLRALARVLLASVIGGCASTPPPRPFPLPRAAHDRIAAGDRVRVRVERPDDDLVSSLVVEADLTVEYPLCGHVLAQGALGDLERAIGACLAERYGGAAQSVHVDVVEHGARVAVV